MIADITNCVHYHRPFERRDAREHYECGRLNNFKAIAAA